MEMTDPWPTVIAKSQYPGNLEKVKNIILEANEKFAHGQYNTTRHGHQPKYTVWPHNWQFPDWLPVREWIQGQLEEYCQKVFNVKYPVEVRNSWTVTYNEGGFQEMHAHPGNDISCMLVVQESEGGEFVVPNPATASSFTLFNPWCQKVKVEAGDFLIWPSWMTHYTFPTKGERKKIIISMDAMMVPGREEYEKDFEKEWI
jgi:hypothetical protein